MNYCDIRESCHFISLHSIIVNFFYRCNIVYSIVFLFYHFCLFCTALYCCNPKNAWCQFLLTQLNKSDRKYHYSIDFLFAVYHFIFVKQQISCCCFVLLSCFEVVFFIICQINRFGSWRSVGKKKNTYVLPFHRFMIYGLALQRNKVYSITLVFYHILSNVLSSQNFKSIVRAKV